MEVVAPSLLTFCLNDWLEFSNNNSDDMTDWGSLKNSPASPMIVLKNPFDALLIKDFVIIFLKVFQVDIVISLY